MADYGVAGVAGLLALGLFRTASVLMGPIRLAVTGLALHAIGEGTRSGSFEVDGERRATLLRYAGLISLGGLAWTGAVLLLPQSIAVKLIGIHWPEVRAVFAIASLGWIGFSIVAVSTVQLRIIANARYSLRAQLLSCVPLTAAIFVGAALDGATGAAIGMAIGFAATAFIWWYHVVTAPSPTREDARRDLHVLGSGEPVL